MKRKFKIITAGTASLALLAPIGTVVACGDPEDKDPKMLSFDEFQKSIIKSELNPGTVATEAQKASLKEIYDSLSLEMSKSFTGSYEENKNDGTKKQISFSLNVYLVSKEGDSLVLPQADSHNFSSWEGKKKLNADQNAMYKLVRDNFLKEKNIGKYFLAVHKAMDGNGKLWFAKTSLEIIAKEDNKIGTKKIHILNKD